MTVAFVLSGSASLGAIQVLGMLIHATEPGRVVGLSRARPRARPPHTGRANRLLSAG
jgi:hypothetical protein